jgi:hypothetical protein
MKTLAIHAHRILSVTRELRHVCDCASFGYVFFVRLQLIASGDGGAKVAVDCSFVDFPQISTLPCLVLSFVWSAKHHMSFSSTT